MQGSDIPKQWFLDQGIPLTPDVLTVDFDGDGLSNEQEYIAGTKANDTSSCLKMVIAGSDNPVEVSWDSQWGHWYTIEVSTNLTSDSFKPVVEAIPGEHETTQWTLSITNNHALFYRIKQVEPTP